jgi:hypothetical protein
VLVATVSAFNADADVKDGDDPSGTYYTLEELHKRPQGVDTSKLESYLRNAEFLKIFGMTKKNFESLPAWKKTNLKKAQKLF